jgi:SPP1 gp7 family putative phage head morphogenesis protein
MKGIFSRLKAAAQMVLRSDGAAANAWLRGLDLGEDGGSRMARPFASSVWVQRAIKKVTGPVCAVELGFTGAGDTEVDSPELREFWRAPAVGLSREEWIEASIGWYKLAGEVFWILDDRTLLPYAERGPWPQFIVARPDRMRHVVNGGRLAGWQYRDGAGSVHALLPEQVIHLRSWNPYDDFRGLGEYESAQIAAEADYAAGKFARSLAQSNGDQGVYVVAKGGMPTDEQRLQMTEQLQMKRRMQQAGRFTPLFLTGDVAIEDPKIKAPDGDFVNLRLQNRHEVFLAFGVPPSMADKMESYSIGSASDWFILIFETCVPTGQKLCGGIDQVARRFGLQARSYLDWDEHPVMQAVRRERIANAKDLWGMGMPMSEVNDYMALGMRPFAGWDTGYLPFSVAPVGELPAEPTTDPNLAETDTDQEQESEAVGAMLTALRNAPPAADSCSCSCVGRVNGDLAEADLSQWRQLMSQRRATVRAFESRFNRELMAARGEVLSKLEAKKALLAFPTRAAAADFLFDLSKFTARMTSGIRSVATTALQSAGEQLLKEIGLDDPWQMPPAKALQFLDTRTNKIQGVAQDVFDQVAGTLKEGLSGGESIAELSKRVRAEFNDISRERATRIAMTETAAAYGVARHEAMQKAGITRKKWLTSGNANVRAAHRAMNGAVVPITDPFVVIDPKTGKTDSVMHPADPDGETWNVINCHCVELAVAPSEPDTPAEPSGES